MKLRKRYFENGDGINNHRAKPVAYEDEVDMYILISIRETSVMECD